MKLRDIRILIASVTIGILLIILVTSSITGVRPQQLKHAASRLARGRPQSSSLAYMTLLTGGGANDTETEEDSLQNHYVIATRILAYQLLHQRHTKTRKSIPFVVMVTPDVNMYKRNRLERDGATVVSVDFVTVGHDWMKPGRQSWKSLMTKLRGWQMTQYDKVLFLDNDMIINRCMDGIFDDKAAQYRPIQDSSTVKKHEPEDDTLPPKYLLASTFEARPDPHRSSPPTPEKDANHGPDYFNAGFFMFGPSQKLYDYYTSLSTTKGRWESFFMEQTLLNFAHSRKGALPWQQIEDLTWHARYSNLEDLQAGVASFHDRWWDDSEHDKRLHDLFRGQKNKMDGFFEAWDVLQH